MSDNRRRYRSIKNALHKMQPQEVKGHAARKLNTLAAMISGIVGSRRTNYPHMASKVPEMTKLESRVKRFSRWVNQTEAETQVHLLPFAQELLAGLSVRSLVFIMDGSEVGRHCLSLALNVVYRGRTLPLAWLVVQGDRGHFPGGTHVRLLEAVQPLLPSESDVIFLGDAEFDSVELQERLLAWNWEYVCRTSNNIYVTLEGEQFQLRDLALLPGDCLQLPDVAFTRKGHGPVQIVIWWCRDYEQPIYLVTNLGTAEEACYWYQKRFRIETFFSDQKSRGFHLHKSHLATPERIARLMIAACLAYVWIVYLGEQARRKGRIAHLHRTDRCDLSLFQLGLRYLEDLLNHDLPIPVAFTMPISGFVR